jgi:hypothetical protein
MKHVAHSADYVLLAAMLNRARRPHNKLVERKVLLKKRAFYMKSNVEQSAVPQNRA